MFLLSQEKGNYWSKNICDNVRMGTIYSIVFLGSGMEGEMVCFTYAIIIDDIKTSSLNMEDVKWISWKVVLAVK